MRLFAPPPKSTTMKTYYLLTIAIVTVLASSVDAQNLKTSYHGERAQSWEMPSTVDGSAGIADYPNAELNFMTQFSVRFSGNTGDRLQGVNIWLDSILSGAVDETVSYAGPEAAFAWPFPFNHVPQTFEKQAMRFTAPEDSRLRSIEIYPHTISSEDGFNDSVRVQLFSPLVPQSITVKYGNENVNNNPQYRFNFPILSGNVRTSYGTRFTTPATPDSFRVGSFEYFVFHINGETQFLPAGNNPVDDTLVVRIWALDANNLPDSVIAEQKVLFTDLTAPAWNEVSFVTDELYVSGGEEFILTFSTTIVDLADHLALASGEPFATPLNRTVMHENGNWVLLSASTSFGAGVAKGAELWTRAKLIPSDQVTNDEFTPDESKPLSAPVKIPLSSLNAGEFYTVNFISQGIDLLRNQDFWVVVDLEVVGTPDVLAFVSDAAEVTPTQRAAAYVTDNTGSNWRYLTNTQFNNEFLFRMRSTFAVVEETQVNDNIFVVLYGDANGLPDNFINVREIPLSSLEVGAFTHVDLTSWNYTFGSTDVHIAIGSAFDSNQFALASDDGSNALGQNRSSVFLSKDEAWKALNDLEGVAEVNLLMELEYLQAVSIERPLDSPLAYRLDGNYPNPFNPTTTIQFELADAGQARLAVYDVIGRQVAVLVNQTMSAGTHSVQFNAVSFSSGTYILRLEAGGQTFTSKMLLVK